MFEESKGVSASGGNEATSGTTTTNPFRILNKKDKESQQNAVMSNLDVKRVKYSYKQISPTGEDKHYSPEQESSTTTTTTQATSMKEGVRGGAAATAPSTSPFQPVANMSGKDNLR